MSSIDYDEIRAEARAQVDAELAEITDPRQRREVAEEIREQAFLELSLLKEERQQLVASAAFYESHPLLYMDFGMAYTHLRRLAMGVLCSGLTPEEQLNPPPWPDDRAKAARQAGIPRHRDVVKKAAAVCARYEAAVARRSAAIDYLEATEEVLRTAGGGRIHVKPLVRRNFDDVREQARAEIIEEFAEPDPTPEARLRRAAQVVDLWEREADRLLLMRDAAIASLAFYTTARGVYYAADISRNAYNKVLARALGLRVAELPKRDQQPAAAHAAGVKFVMNAERKLPRRAKRYEGARARHSAAIQIRKEAIREMAERWGWTTPRIAEAIDRDPKAVRYALDAAQKS